MPPHSTLLVYPARVQPLMQSHNRMGKFQSAGSVFSAYPLVPSVFGSPEKEFMEVLCSRLKPSVMATCLVDCLPVLNSWSPGSETNQRKPTG